MIRVEDLPLIADILSAIRSGLERRIASGIFVSRKLEGLYMDIERIRIRFGSRSSMLRSMRRPNFENISESLFELKSNIEPIINSNGEVYDYLRSIRVVRNFSRAYVNSSPKSELYYAVNQIQESREANNVANLLAALSHCLDGGIDKEMYFTVLDFEINSLMNLEVRERLRKIIPSQKVSPVHFDIEFGKIIIVDRENLVDENSKSIAVQAREELIRGGDDIISHVRLSNCDRRLVGSFEDLQRKLKDSDNVISLGITSIGFSEMVRAFHDELPTAIAAMIHAHVIGVGMYIAQFPDWIKFSENAASAKIMEGDYSRISNIISDVVNTLESDRALSHPEVPITFRHINEMIGDPGRASKRVAFAAVRTIENLISKIFTYSIELLTSSAEKTIKRTSDAVSIGIASAILSVGLTMATQISPIATRIEGMSWIKDAASVIEKSIGN